MSVGPKMAIQQRGATRVASGECVDKTKADLAAVQQSTLACWPNILTETFLGQRHSHGQLGSGSSVKSFGLTRAALMCLTHHVPERGKTQLSCASVG